MRLTTLLRIAAVLSLGSLAVFCASAQDSTNQQNPDPMAEAARKARAEQQNNPKPKKVFTNDDFAASPSTAKSTDSTAKPANAKEDDKDAAENDPKSEAYWRKRFAKAHAKLAQAEQELDVLQRELDKNEVQYYPDPQTALMQQYTRKDINDNKAKLDAKKKEVDTLKQQISDMEDELRKAGGDSGWAR
jgi:chromosome segregation ATPase